MLNQHDRQYHELIYKLTREGVEKPDRTGTGIISSFGHKMVFDVSETIPILTTKKVNFKAILHETLWMFSQGDTNIKYLLDNNVGIWKQWANSENELGPIYGRQARAFQSYKEVDGKVIIENVDQISNVVENIKNNPYSRRHVVSLWNPSTVPPDSNNFEELIEEGYSALAICHGNIIQFYVEGDGGLSVQVYTRL